MICTNIALGDCFPSPSLPITVVVIARLVLSEKHSVILDFIRRGGFNHGKDSGFGPCLSAWQRVDHSGFNHCTVARPTCSKNNVSLLRRQGKVCQLASCRLSSRTESQRKRDARSLVGKFK